MDAWGITAVGYLVSLLGAAGGGVECLALAGLDLQRSIAWSAGSADSVEALYVDADSAGPDLEALQRWTDRGLVLESAMLITGSCDVLSVDGDRVQLEVVDRLMPTWAIDDTGVATSLPVDGWSARTVVLERVDGMWRYAEVSER